MQQDSQWCVHNHYTLQQFGLPDHISGSVLDIGCSAGGMSQCFTPDQYLGIDCMLHTVRTAQKTYPLYNFAHFDQYHPTYNPRGQLTNSDLHTLGKFDWIFLRSVYTHMAFESALAHLESVKQCLAPGGSVYYTLWDLSDCEQFYQAVKETFTDTTHVKPQIPTASATYITDYGQQTQDPSSADKTLCSFFDLAEFASRSDSTLSHRVGNRVPHAQWVLIYK